MTTSAKTPRQLLVEIATSTASASAPSLAKARECPGAVCEVSEEEYFEYLEALPPQLIDGVFFCFAEGSEPYLLFWKRAGRHYARQLSWDETTRLAKLAGIPLPGDW